MAFSHPVQGSSRTASPEYKRLARLPKPELERIMLGGETPALLALVGHEYIGYNTAPTTTLLGIRTFIKAFFTIPGGRVYGCNTPVAQNGLDGSWRATPREGSPRRYAFFSVAPVDPEVRDNKYLHALLLNYAEGRNPLYDPSRLLRDYLVRCIPGSDDLLLGKAYMALGPARLAAGYFLLERYRPLRQLIELPGPLRARVNYRR
jgi:hypothetical protein